jgi:transposase-like protein
VLLISGGGFVLGEIQRIKHQQALEYWSQILKEQQESGLCIKAFCRSRQMSHHAMYYWLKELRKEALSAKPQAPACTTQFAAVSLAQDEHHSCGNMVVHVGSASLEIPEGTAVPDLQRMLQVLKEVFLC